MYQSETRIACGGDVYSQNQDEMGNLYRGPSIDASYQVLGVIVEVAYNIDLVDHILIV